jgi:small subunit ribosomal protein S20
MPTTKSAKKRLRQSLERRARNRAARSALKTQSRKVRELAASGDAAQGNAELRVMAKKLDKAAARKVIHPNTAARLKSRLSKRLKAAVAAKAPTPTAT